jgi:sec-independent protein translocase protein TatB
MFDIGWSELLVIAVVAIVVVGPKDLPRLMRGFGTYAGKLRRAASDFQRQFEDAMRESEIDEVRKAIESAKAQPLGLDQPVMLPKPASFSADAPAKPTPPAKSKSAAKLKPARKRAAAKPKSAAQRPKAKAERTP